MAIDPAGALPPDPRIGTVLAERYRIDSLIGEGGMGKVYQAEHILMRKRLAVKVLHRELSAVPELVARFEREAMAAAHIEHANVAAATDFGKLPDGSVFLVLEYIEGRCLRDEMNLGPMPAARALHIARQVAQALGSAHTLGIVHRDLKPENVMLVDKGGDSDFVKVLDFGVAKVPLAEDPGTGGKVITRSGMVFGTPEYMAPEQALGQPLDGRADLYALGVMLFEMIAGVRPFAGDSKVSLIGQQLAKVAPKIAERVPGLSVAPEVEHLVHRLLEKEAGKRMRSANNVITGIGAIIGPPARPRFPTPVVLSPLDADDAVSDPDIELVPDEEPADPLILAQQSGGERLRGKLQKLQKNAIIAIDRSRPDWPRKLRKFLSRVPANAILWGLLGLAGLFALILVLIVGSLLSSDDDANSVAEAPPSAEPAASLAPSATTPAPPAEQAAQQAIPSKNPEAAELERAREAGLVELQALAKRFPESAAVLLEIARLHADQKDYASAVAATKRALELEPERHTDRRAASVLFLSAQAKSSVEDAFALLEGPMKERGAVIAHDLAVYAPKGSVAQKRAEAFLRSPRFEAVAAEPIRVAAKLRAAKSCDTVLAILPRVLAVGDKHSLPYLQFFAKNPDVYACVTKDDMLKKVTAAVESRVKQASGKE
jgi:serine/threonine protein kinase